MNSQSCVCVCLRVSHLASSEGHLEGLLTVLHAQPADGGCEVALCGQIWGLSEDNETKETFPWGEHKGVGDS